MQQFMVGLVGIMLVAIAVGTVIVMFRIILGEKHEYTEHYIPEGPGAEKTEESP